MVKRNIKKKIFIGVVEVGGYYDLLKKGLEELDEKVTFVNLYEHPFKYSASSENNFLIQAIRYCIKNRTKNHSKALLNLLLLILEIPLRLILFIWALTNHNIFIFGYTYSFFNCIEFPLLKLCKKKIICVFHGSDTRPYYISGLTLSPDLNLSIEQCIKFTRNQKNIIRWIEKYADLIINHPPSAHFHEKPFIQWLCIGIPQNPSPQSFESTFNKSPLSKTIKIVHAPSRPECKGTEQFHQIIKNMINKGFLLELIELVGRPNSEVLKELSQCDFVIDELYSDTPMASLASEAAIFAKPTVVGGYATFSDMGKIPDEAMPPTVYCHPDKVEFLIEKLITDEKYRLEMGKKAYEFIQKQWASQAVAKRFQMLINNTYPKEWLYEPSNISYLHGWGLSTERCQNLLKAVITEGGRKALQVMDKPNLEKSFLKFAGISDKKGFSLG